MQLKQDLKESVTLRVQAKEPNHFSVILIRSA